jgi:hypothetical protein
MKHIALIVLAVLTAATVAHAETREEMKARLSAISAQCAERTNEYYFDEEARRASDCLRIGSLRDDLLRCASERNRLREAACLHRWIDSAKGTKFCEKCGIYAIQHVNGDWMLVPCRGRWIGAEPR